MSCNYVIFLLTDKDIRCFLSKERVWIEKLGWSGVKSVASQLMGLRYTNLQAHYQIDEFYSQFKVAHSCAPFKNLPFYGEKGHTHRSASSEGSVAV